MSFGGMHNSANDIGDSSIKLYPFACAFILGILHLKSDELLETNQVSGAYFYNSAISDTILSLLLHVLQPIDILYCASRLSQRTSIPCNLFPFLQEFK